MKKFLFKAIQAALAGGAEIMKVYSSPLPEIKLKPDQSPLTLADTLSNLVITDILSSTNIPVLSEEGKNTPYETRRSWDCFWLVDPLDGTKEFIKRNGEFTVNIALIEQRQPILGVIFVPATGELFFSEKNTGAYKSLLKKTDDNYLKSTEDVLKKAVPLPLKENRKYKVIAVSRSHSDKKTESFLCHVKQKYPDAQSISRGSSLKFCLLAEGKADIYPRHGQTCEWDIAAGHAIISHCGFSMQTVNGKPFPAYNKKKLLNPGFIASTLPE